MCGCVRVCCGCVCVCVCACVCELDWVAWAGLGWLDWVEVGCGGVKLGGFVVEVLGDIVSWWL